jgi:hypothetical protein
MEEVLPATATQIQTFLPKSARNRLPVIVAAKTAKWRKSTQSWASTLSLKIQNCGGKFENASISSFYP